MVRSYGRPDDDSGEQCSIEVDFHDTTFHSSMMMQNYQGYTMGSLSTTALVVANSRFKRKQAVGRCRIPLLQPNSNNSIELVHEGVESHCSDRGGDSVHRLF